MSGPVGSIFITIIFIIICYRASQVGLAVKNPPASAGDIRYAGSVPELEDPLEEGMAIHSSILAWQIPWTEKPDKLWSIGSQRVGYS